MARRLVPALVLGVAAATASAQDRDPFDAVRDAQALRAKQMTQVSRADDRIAEPFVLHPGAPPKPPAPAPGPPPVRRDRTPWIVAGGALVLLVGVWWVRSALRPRS